MSMKKEIKEGKLERIDVEIGPTDLEYSIIQFPREYREIFPGYKLDFILETNIGPIITHMTSAPKNTRIGDNLAGSYISGGRLAGENVVGLKTWYEYNNVNFGNWIRIEVSEWHKRYELKKLKRMS